MKLWLIRHGLTRFSEERRYQGRLDEGLSENGRAALKTASFRPDAIYVSPALRARETAAILFPQAGQLVLPGLREMDFGAFEGRGAWEMENDAAYRAWVDGGCAGRCPGGESRAEYTERVCAAADAILQSGREECVVVAHGGTMMALLDGRGEPAREYWQWQRPCGCGWLLRYDREREKLCVEREVSFLR